MLPIRHAKIAVRIDHPLVDPFPLYGNSAHSSLFMSIQHKQNGLFRQDEQEREGYLPSDFFFFMNGLRISLFIGR